MRRVALFVVALEALEIEFEFLNIPTVEKVAKFVLYAHYTHKVVSMDDGHDGRTRSGKVAAKDSGIGFEAAHNFVVALN